MKKQRECFIYSRESVNWPAGSRIAGAKPKQRAIRSRYECAAKISTGRETFIIDLPWIILRPIFLIINERTRRYAASKDLLIKFSPPLLANS